MKAEKFAGIYFSPTGNTAKVVNAIGDRLGGSAFSSVDLTRPENRGIKRNFGPDDAVIVGMPVYRGRLPQVAAAELCNLSGTGTPAIILVTYGNRVFEDALLELKDILLGRGFIPFGAAAFVGQHSFNKEIGYNRPDRKDFAVAKAFADDIRARLETLDKQRPGLVVPGDRPYKEVGPVSGMPFYPETDADCIYCMLCSQYCPVEAISFSNPKAIDTERCIRCTSCIKVCPVQAKKMTPGVFEDFVRKITTPGALRRKEPWYFV